VQYSIGNPTEASINPAANRNPRVVSMGVQVRAGPFYPRGGERHFDLFGGSGLLSAVAPTTATTPNTANATVNSKDTAVQLTACTDGRARARGGLEREEIRGKRRDPDQQLPAVP